MPSDNLTSLFGSVEHLSSDQRTEVLACAAAAFDEYVVQEGHEPSACFVILMKEGQRGRVLSYVDDKSDEAYMDMTAKAALLMQHVALSTTFSE